MQKAVQITGSVLGDGVTRNVGIDLLRDPYSGATSNWFSLNDEASNPVSVVAVDTNKYALSGLLLVVTFATIPANNKIVTWTCNLLF